MITMVELAMLRAADQGAALPGVDTPTGNLLASPSLMQLSQISTLWNAPFLYNAATNIVYVKQNGAVLNGINFGAATVEIVANNVTIENCTFAGTTNYMSLQQQAGYTGAVVQNCTFTTNGQTNPILGAYIISPGQITITGNSFLDAAGDGVDIGAGTVSGNYFSGAGYNSSGVHPDAIWVTNTTGPVVISDNFIDWTPSAGDSIAPNDAIRITTEVGSVSNVTVAGNYLIGGSSVIDAGNAGTHGTFSNINISNNYIGFGTYGDFYPGPQTGVTATGNIIFDFTNPSYSAAAWTAYQASGIVTNSLISATSSNPSISAAATGSSTLYGAGVTGAHLFGGSSETVFVGGAGVQYLWSGAGGNIFSYLAISDSTVNASDAIGNFHAATDVIDLHAIDANPLSSTLTNFTFIGGAAFSSAGGEVRVVQDVAHNQTLVEATLAGDATADLEIRVLGLVNLTAANFALTPGQYAVDLAADANIASFLTAQAALNHAGAGLSIVDTAANVQPLLDALQADAGNIASIRLTGGRVSVSTATFAADQTLLDKIVGGYSVADSADNVQAQLDGLQADAANINLISLTSGNMSVSTATFAADQTALDKIAGGFSLTDSADNIQAQLDGLQADAANINWISLTDGNVSVSTATFAADQTALDEIAGGFSLSDSSSNVQAQLAGLQADAANINWGWLTSGNVSVSAATFAADQAALDEIVGGFGVTDSAAVVTAQLAALQADAGNINLISLTNGNVSVSTAVFAVDQNALDEIAGGFSVTDSAANVQAQLDGLQADAANIDLISLTGGNVTVSAATFAADETALDEIAGGFSVSDSSGAVQAQLDGLQADAGYIGSVTLINSTNAKPAVLSLSAADAAADAAILAKITSPYVLQATSGAATTVTGHGNDLTINIGTGANMITGGGTGETFVFASHFGSAQINDFAPNASGASHDVISLATADFANWATLIADGHASGANTIFTAADGASLTLVGMSLSSLQHANAALQADFKFHA